MKESAEAVVRFIAAVLLIIFVLIASSFFFRFILCFSAAKAIPNIVQIPIMRVIIYGSSSENDKTTVSARISLLDLNSTEIAAIERSWIGSSLSVSFISSSFSGKTIWFPLSIYVNDYSLPDFVQGSKGTKLFPYYSENRVCFLYNSNTNEKIQKNIEHLLSYSLNSRFRPFSRFSEQKVISLSECENGVSYSIYSGFDGRLFILKE